MAEVDCWKVWWVERDGTRGSRVIGPGAKVHDATEELQKHASAKECGMYSWHAEEEAV